MKIDREKFLAAALILGAVSATACKGKTDDVSADQAPGSTAKPTSVGQQAKVVTPGGPAAEGLPPPPSREGLPVTPPGGRPPGAAPPVVPPPGAAPPGGRPPGPAITVKKLPAVASGATGTREAEFALAAKFPMSRVCGIGSDIDSALRCESGIGSDIDSGLRCESGIDVDIDSGLECESGIDSTIDPAHAPESDTTLATDPADDGVYERGSEGDPRRPREPRSAPLAWQLAPLISERVNPSSTA